MPINERDSEALARQFNISCEAADELDCESVALLVHAINDSSFTFCSSFIVGEMDGKTVMATNNHCLGENPNDHTCGAKVAFSFAAAENHFAETAACQRVIKTSSLKEMHRPDYAFLLLNKKIDRPAMTVSMAGVKGDELLKVIHLDTESWNSSIIRTSECESVKDSTFNWSYVSETSPTIALYGCRMQYGNSGAAVVNSAGQVAAILHAGAADEDEIQKKKILDHEFREYTKNMDLTLVNLATNFACIDFPEIGLVPLGDNACEQNVDRSMSHLSVTGGIEAGQKIHEEMQSWVSQQSLILLPQFRVDKSVHVSQVLEIDSSPLCFMPPSPENDWLKKYRHKYWFGYATEGEETVEFKTWSMNMELDSRGRPKLYAKSDEKFVRIKFDPNHLVRNGFSKVSLDGLDRAGASLSFCSQADIQNIQSGSLGSSSKWL